MQQREHELVVVERAVELNGEAIGDCGVVYVMPGFACRHKEVAAGTRLGFRGLVVDELGVDERDLEAARCELDGQFYGWDYMALERVGDEDGVRLLVI